MIWWYLYFRILVRVVLKFEQWRYGTAARTEPPVARSYRPGDERRIIRLFRLAFRKTKSLTRWRWEFLESPFGIRQIVVLEHQAAGIVGHLGGIVVRFNYRGRIVPAAQTVDIMIHPAFRGTVAFERLGHTFLERARENGITLLYGFTGPHIARSYRRFFGARYVPVSEWSCDTGRLSASRSSDARTLRISEVQQFDARANVLWETLRNHYVYSAVRDRDYLTWRYDARSDRRYVLLEATELSSGRLQGLMVLGTEESDGLILELLSAPEDRSAVSALLAAAVEHAAIHKLRRVRAWLTPHGRFHECARALGFVPIESNLELVVLDPQGSHLDPGLETDLYYSMGDYDVP